MRDLIDSITLVREQHDPGSRYFPVRWAASPNERLQSPTRFRFEADPILGYPSLHPCFSRCFVESAAALFSNVASCRLHAIDPEQYLNDVLRLLPYWPKERYLELAPKNWQATRARLRSDELEAPLGAFTIPAA